jgi:hypothetical protein
MLCRILFCRFVRADNAVRVRTQNAVNGLALFDANNQVRAFVRARFMVAGHPFYVTTLCLLVSLRRTAIADQRDDVCERRHRHCRSGSLLSLLFVCSARPGAVCH